MDDQTIDVRARDEVVEDFLLRGMCSRDEAQAEATRLLRARIEPLEPIADAQRTWPRESDPGPSEGGAGTHI